MDKAQKLIKDVESNGGSTEDLSSLVENLSSGLADVKEKSDNRNQNIVSSMKHGKRFQDLLSNLVLALKINEEKLEKMTKPKADTEDVSKKLKEARVRISHASFHFDCLYKKYVIKTYMERKYCL